MSTAEIKDSIIKKLNSIEDETLLFDVYKLLNMESGMETIYEVSNEEIEALDAAFQDVDEGKTYSSSSAKKLLEKWLKK